MSFSVKDADEIDQKVLDANKLSGSQMGSYYFMINRINEKFKQPLKVSMKSKRSASIFESPTLYRIGEQNILTKVESSVKNNNVFFETDQSGTYVLKYEKNIWAILGLVIGIVALVILIGCVVLFFIMNPRFFRSLSYRASNLKMSLSSKI